MGSCSSEINAKASYFLTKVLKTSGGKLNEQVNPKDPVQASTFSNEE